MRFTVSAFILALLAASANLVVAVPPACLLAAVNTEQNPSDLNTICGTDSLKVQQQIQKLCGGGTQDALKAFASTCSGAGKTVTLISASASATASSSGSAPTGSSHNSTLVFTSSFFDSSCSCTKTTQISTTTEVSSFATSASAAGTGAASNASGATGASGTATATGSGSASQSTGGANKNMGSMVAAVIAIAGVAIAL